MRSAKCGTGVAQCGGQEPLRAKPSSQVSPVPFSAAVRRPCSAADSLTPQSPPYRSKWWTIAPPAAVACALWGNLVTLGWVMAVPKYSRFRASFNRDQLEWFKDGGKNVGFGAVGAVHKGSVTERPYRFFNEIVAGTLAQALLLPMPPFALTWFDEKSEAGERDTGPLFSSIDFNYERQTPPKPDFDILYENFPTDCAGALLFDIVIANPDRSRDNIWCDSAASPTQFFIFDHDVALLGGEHDGVARLEAEEDRLGLRFLQDSSDSHPFLRRVASVELLENWFNKFYKIPDWFIDEACRRAAKTIDISAKDVRTVQRILQYRCRNLEHIVTKYGSLFTGIGDWSTGQLF